LRSCCVESSILSGVAVGCGTRAEWDPVPERRSHSHGVMGSCTLAWMRACTRCGVEKPLEAFPLVRRGEAKLESWCRGCFATYGKMYYRANRDVQKARVLR